MKEPVYADAGYWIAITSGDDALHERAVAVTAEIKSRQIITSEFVLAEYLDGSADWGDRRRKAAARFVRKMEQEGSVRIIPATHELFAEALRLYETRLDKEWGLTDCTSFVICEHEGITEALAHDQHFAQAGIRALLRDPAP